VIAKVHRSLRICRGPRNKPDQTDVVHLFARATSAPALGQRTSSPNSTDRPLLRSSECLFPLLCAIALERSYDKLATRRKQRQIIALGDEAPEASGREQHDNNSERA